MVAQEAALAGSATAPNTARSLTGDRLPPLTARNAPATVGTPREQQGVSMPVLLSFCYPPTQEHPEALGRLELFARYGPTDENGRLRGGIAGSHGHTDAEVHQMIRTATKEAFFKALKQPKSQIEVMVDTVLPEVLEENIERAEIKKLLSSVPKDENARMNFTALQDIILTNQQHRLKAFMKHGPKKKEREMKVPYQCKQAEALLRITKKKKMSVPEANYAQG